jgi:hypothetical protein
MKPGVCSIPVCTSRTPLEGHLCRVSVDEECFVYISSKTAPLSEGTCVDVCPAGSEMEFNSSNRPTGFIKIVIFL